MAQKKRVLFVCAANSCRGRIAQAWVQRLLGDRIEAFSAGIVPRRLDPYAERVMREVDLDLAAQGSHSLDDFYNRGGSLRRPLDFIVVLCDRETEPVPQLPMTVLVVHHAFANVQSATVEASEAEREAAYRALRDEISDFVTKLPYRLGLR